MARTILTIAKDCHALQHELHIRSNKPPKDIPFLDKLRRFKTEQRIRKERPAKKERDGDKHAFIISISKPTV